MTVGIGNHLETCVKMLLSSGEVATATEAEVVSGHIFSAGRSGPLRSQEENEAVAGEEILAALVVLDPCLRQARYRCVPAVANERRWWVIYMNCLRVKARNTLQACL